VWKTTDGGKTWIPIDGDGTPALPDIPVHAVIVDPDHHQNLYPATTWVFLPRAKAAMSGRSKTQDLPML